MHVSYKSFRGDKSDGFGTSILLMDHNRHVHEDNQQSYYDFAPGLVSRGSLPFRFTQNVIVLHGEVYSFLKRGEPFAENTHKTVHLCRTHMRLVL